MQMIFTHTRPEYCLITSVEIKNKNGNKKDIINHVFEFFKFKILQNKYVP